jgi:hypothetical protein
MIIYRFGGSLGLAENKIENCLRITLLKEKHDALKGF